MILRKGMSEGLAAAACDAAWCGVGDFGHACCCRLQYLLLLDDDVCVV